MINTLNESSLHKSLKTLYSDGNKLLQEIKIGEKIYDIVTEEGNIIEIQTKNLAKLFPKINECVSRKRFIKIVHPVAVEKIIETCDQNGKIISKRKSPQKCSIYDVAKELIGLHPVLQEKYVSLEIVGIVMKEKRMLEEKKVQSKNKRRRFNKNWNKIDKCIEKILWFKTFSSKSDYISLIPKKCLPLFCAKDIRRELKADKTLPSSACKNAHALLWLLSHMELIIHTETKLRNKYYALQTTRQ